MLEQRIIPQLIADTSADAELRTESMIWTAQIRRIHEVDPGYEPTVEQALAFYLPFARTLLRSTLETAVRQGKTQLFLTDEHQSATRAGIAMILATAGVHTHLVRKGLRTYASINVRAAEALDTHYFAVLVGVGATTVNAYLAQEAIADRQARGLFAGLSFGLNLTGTLQGGGTVSQTVAPVVAITSLAQSLSA